jgi:hypothetical protein
MIPKRSMRKGGSTKPNSTAVVPLSHEIAAALGLAAIAYPILIQLVLVMEVMPRAPITLRPGNND